MHRLQITLALLLGTAAISHANTMAAEPASEPTLQDREDGSWGHGLTVRGDENPLHVTFTFDDGPDLATTPKVLEALEEYGVPATFFVVGRRFASTSSSGQKGAELLRDMAARGFLIGNHTTAHQSLSSQPFRAAAKSIVSNAEALAIVLGYEPRLFRPPFGVTTAKIRKFLRSRGDTIVRWNIDPQDFQRAKRKNLRHEVVRTILARQGGVVLMHDTKIATAKALKGILKDLEKANCERLAAGQEPILPVSLHYFMHNADGSARAIPAEVVKTTQESRDSLIRTCKKDN